MKQAGLLLTAESAESKLTLTVRRESTWMQTAAAKVR